MKTSRKAKRKNKVMKQELQDGSNRKIQEGRKINITKGVQRKKRKKEDRESREVNNE